MHQSDAGQLQQSFENDIDIAVHERRNVVNRWSELAKAHDLDLVVCVAAAQRRGIVDPDEAKRNGKDGDNIAEGFRISGLGQLIEAGIQSDRMMEFGD